MGKWYGRLAINFDYWNKHIAIDNVHALEKLGAGHDGIVYAYDDLALKIFKSEKILAYKSALAFSDLTLKKVVGPCGIIFDDNGAYCGYIMKKINKVSDDVSLDAFKPEQMVHSIVDLKSDFMGLSSKGIVAEDINNGSFLIDEDSFLHLCDVDKYVFSNSSVSARNKQRLHYAISRFMVSHMPSLSDSQKATYVRKSTTDPEYLRSLEMILDGSNNYGSVGEFVKDVEETVKKR